MKTFLGWLLLNVIILGMAPLAWPQDAKVIELKPEDAAQAQVIYTLMKDAEKEWADFQQRVKRDYTVVPKGQEDRAASEAYSFEPGKGFMFSVSTNCTVLLLKDGQVHDDCPESTKDSLERARAEGEKDRLFYRLGWEGDFDFTGDFRFIVPKAPMKATPWYAGNGCLTLTPANLEAGNEQWPRLVKP